MSQHINICWDFFLSILFEFPSCNNLSKLSNSLSITKNTDMSVFFLHFKNLCIFASDKKIAQVLQGLNTNKTKTLTCQSFCISGT